MIKDRFSAIMPIDGVVDGPQADIVLGISTSAGKLTNIQFLPLHTAPFCAEESAAVEAVRQIHAYFSDPGWIFKLPMGFFGSPFQNRVWRALTKIKSGETMTYGEMAKQLHTSARAVGNACRRNPLPIVVPCHRIVAKTGLGGFSGQTEGDLVDFKRYLLKHELKHELKPNSPHELHYVS